MKFLVIFNGITYDTEVDLQTALDFIKYRAKRANGKGWNAALIMAETGEVVYETNG